MSCIEWLGCKASLPSNPAMNLLFSRLIKGKEGKKLAVCVDVSGVTFVEKKKHCHFSPGFSEHRGYVVGNSKLVSRAGTSQRVQGVVRVLFRLGD